MKQLKRVTNVLLKMLLGALVILAVLTSLPGCSSAPLKNGSPEIWKIDPDDATLYRVISDTREKATFIKGNDSMRRFRCVIDSEIDELVSELIGDE